MSHHEGANINKPTLNEIMANLEVSLQRMSLNSMGTSQRKLLMAAVQQITPFDGTGEVERWVTDFQYYAGVAGITEDKWPDLVRTLLIGKARDWFEYNDEIPIKKWSAIKQALIDRYKKKVTASQLFAAWSNFTLKEDEDYADLLDRYQMSCSQYNREARRIDLPPISTKEQINHLMRKLPLSWGLVLRADLKLTMRELREAFDELVCHDERYRIAKPKERQGTAEITCYNCHKKEYVTTQCT